MKKVLEALRKAGMSLKPEKSEFHKKEVEFLGSIITTEGIRMDQKKVKAVQEWPVPKSVKEIQAFLGFANFYRRFIRNYSKVAAPLTEMTKKRKDFK